MHRTGDDGPESVPWANLESAGRRWLPLQWSARVAVEQAHQILAGEVLHDRKVGRVVSAVAVDQVDLGDPQAKLSFLAADHHGTSSIAMDATRYAVTANWRNCSRARSAFRHLPRPAAASGSGSRTAS